MRQAGHTRGCWGILVLLGVAGGACLPAPQAWGKGIVVKNVTLVTSQHPEIQFDLSWQNSWRSSWTEEVGTNRLAFTNWDAAWVFAKYHVKGTEGWRHATLATTGHTVPAGVSIDTTSDGVGAFLHRSTNGSGDVSYPGVRLRWNGAADGVSPPKEVEVSVQAIEMVYVPQGSFYAGSSGGELFHFYTYPSESAPYLICSDARILVGKQAGFLHYYSGGDGGTIPAAFPKGYAAFYCMKYELSQGQYTDFLNKLTSKQAAARALEDSWIHQMGRRETGLTINGRWPSFTCGAPNHAANWISWGDATAYADWAGLRPMTELEFEKACRGPMYPVPDEYAWGDTVAILARRETGTPGSGTETPDPPTANCSETEGNSDEMIGVQSAGIFESATATRAEAGAGYFGVMQLSGDVWELCVSVGNPQARAFTATHGDGATDESGNANVPSWPGTEANNGIGWRGKFYKNARHACVSDRENALVGGSARKNYFNWRGVRSVPAAAAIAPPVPTTPESDLAGLCQTGKVIVAPMGPVGATVSDFVSPKGAPAKARTTATVCWDATGLSVRFDCADAQLVAKPNRPRDDGDMWKDDGVEVFVDVGHTHLYGSRWIHVLLTAEGGIYDEAGPARYREGSTDPQSGTLGYSAAGLKTKVERTASGWQGEISIPWSDLGARPAPGDVWGFNLNRTQWPEEEYLCWSPTKGMFMTLPEWGHLVFANDAKQAEKGLQTMRATHSDANLIERMGR